MPHPVGHSLIFSPALPSALPSALHPTFQASIQQPRSAVPQPHFFYSALHDSLGQKFVLRKQLSAPRQKRAAPAADFSAPASTGSTNVQALQDYNVTSIAPAIESPMLSIGKQPNHHANPMRHALRRYFHAIPKWQLNQLLKDPGVIVNRLYADLKKKSASAPSAPVSNSRAARDCCDAGALEVFLSAVAKEIDVSDKNIDPAYGMHMLQETLHAIVKTPSGDIDKNEIPFAIADYDFLAEGRLFKSINVVRKEFRRHLKNSMPALKPEAARWLATQLLAGYEPVLDRTDVPDECIYGSLIFSDIQAGIDTAVAINIDPAILTWEVLAGLADTIDIAARSNPDFDPLFYQPQIEAALRFANARHHIDIHRDGITSEVITRAVAERDRARIAWRDRALEPIRKAIEFLQRPAPDRTEIAKTHLIALGIDPYEIARDTRTRQTGLGLCSGDRPLGQLYLDDCEFRLNNALQKAGLELTELADLDAEYSKELDSYFTELTQSTATLIAMSANQLDADDYLFWNNNPVRLLQAIVSVTELSGVVPGNFGPQAPPRDQTTTINGEKTLIFASGDGDSMRFYQVSLTDAQISLEHAKLGIVKRITLASGDNINDYIDGRRELFFEPAALEKIPEFARTVIYGAQQLGATELPPHAARSTQAAAAAFSSFIREEQYEQGYKITGLQQFRRTMGNFAKSLLPFHDCIVSVNEGRQGEAVADCSLEALSVLPLSRLILFSQKLRKPLTLAFIRSIGKAGVRGLSRKTLSGAATGMQSTLQSAGKGLVSGLGKDFISAVDPGFDAAYKLTGFLARFAKRNLLSSLGRLIAAHPKKYLLLQEILRSDPRTKALSDMLKRQAEQPYRYDLRTDGWYRRSNGAGPFSGTGTGAGAIERRFAQASGPAEDGLLVACAKRLIDNQCSTFVKQNPMTQKTYGPYLRPLPGNRGSLRLMLPLEPAYPGKHFSDEIDRGFEILLPPGAEIESLGFLKQHPLYRNLPDSVALFELDDKHYAWDSARPFLGLRKVSKNLLEEYAPALCRDKRGGGGGSACGFTIKKLSASNSAPQQDSFQLVFGRGNYDVTQYDLATRKDVVSTEAIQIQYLTPPLRTSGQSKDVMQYVILTPDQSYRLQKGARGLWQKKINEIDAVKFGIDEVETTIPETGLIVPFNADAASGGGLRAIEIQLKNGRHRCTHRAVFGTYPSPDGKTHHGMIRLGESNLSYYQFEYTARVRATNKVVLAPATQTDIDAYRRFQDMKVGQRRRDKFNSNHRIQLNHGDAGSLLRIYEHYNLAPYRQLLPEIAAQFGVDQARAAAMVDAYINNPIDPARQSELGKLKRIFETSVHAQFSSPEAVGNLYERITDAIVQADGPLQMRRLEMAPEDLDEIMETLAERYPAMDLPLVRYKSMVGNGQKFSARNLRLLITDSFSNTVGAKNIAFARIQFHENGVLTKQETIHSISGMQQTNRDSYSYVPVKPLTSSSFDADEAYAAAERNQEADTDALYYFSDYDQSGNRKIRAFDAEIKTIGLIRKRLSDPNNNAPVHSIKIFTRLAPCVVCTQAIAILSKEYPDIKIEIVHFAPHRKLAGATASASGGSPQEAAPRRRRSTGNLHFWEFQTTQGQEVDPSDASMGRRRSAL